MKQNKWLLLLLLFPLFVACFEDKTTLDNIPISEITIEGGIESVYNIKKFEKLVITPVISQTNKEKELKYVWEVNFKNESNEAVFEYEGNELGKFNCRLIVENEDGKAFFPFVVYVNSDYEYGITVLSKDENGNSMLSFMQEPMTPDDVAEFTSYDCFTRNNPDEHFAANAADIVQSGGRLVIACQGGGANNDDPAIYYLNEKTMVIENMFTVPEYSDFKPKVLGVPIVSPIAAVYPILCENGKVYDFAIVEGVVSKPRKLKSTYALNCLTNVNGSYYDILLFDKDNKGMSLIYNGNGPYFCSSTYHLMLDDAEFTTKNHFANRELVAMVKVHMTAEQKNLVAGHNKFLVITKLAGTLGVGVRSEVLYTDFWGYDFVNNEPTFYTAHTKSGVMMNGPLTPTTPCIANETNYTLLFATNNQVRRWGYASTTTGFTDLINAPVLLTVGSPMAQITGFEISADHKKTYVSFYDPMISGKNGSVWVFDTETGTVLEKYNNICYKPVKMFYKTR